MSLGEGLPKLVEPGHVDTGNGDSSSACSFPSQTGRVGGESHLSVSSCPIPGTQGTTILLLPVSQNPWGGDTSPFYSARRPCPCSLRGWYYSVKSQAKSRNSSVTFRHVHSPGKGISTVVSGFRPRGHIVSPGGKPPLRPPTNTSPVRRVSDGSVPLFPRRVLTSPFLHRGKNIRLITASATGGAVPSNPIYGLTPFLALSWSSLARARRP